MGAFSLNLEAVWAKIKNYCAFQERCSQEVIQKLRTLGVEGKNAGTLIERLKAEGFLDDNRYMAQFVSGKLRNNHWGRIKIAHHLRMNGFSHTETKRGLAIIDPAEYQAVLKSVAEKKIATLRKETKEAVRSKTTSYLAQKGFGRDEITEIFHLLNG